MTRRDFFTAYFLCKLHKTPYSGIQSCSEEQFVLRGHAPTPYQSGSFNASERKISKRGNSYLRKTGYEIMQSLIKHKPADDPVYAFIQKKRSEGKCGKEAMIAGLNKFLRVYYNKVMELCSAIDSGSDNSPHIA